MWSTHQPSDCACDPSTCDTRGKGDSSLLCDAPVHCHSAGIDYSTVINAELLGLERNLERVLSTPKCISAVVFCATVTEMGPYRCGSLLAKAVCLHLRQRGEKTWDATTWSSEDYKIVQQKSLEQCRRHINGAKWISSVAVSIFKLALTPFPSLPWEEIWV